jgi:hypothetical protein
MARREHLDPDLRAAFGLSGTAHLLAISGFHVGVVAGLLLAASAWRGRPSPEVGPPLRPGRLGVRAGHRGSRRRAPGLGPPLPPGPGPPPGPSRLLGGDALHRLPGAPGGGSRGPPLGGVPALLRRDPGARDPAGAPGGVGGPGMAPRGPDAAPPTTRGGDGGAVAPGELRGAGGRGGRHPSHPPLPGLALRSGLAGGDPRHPGGGPLGLPGHSRNRGGPGRLPSSPSRRPLPGRRGGPLLLAAVEAMVLRTAHLPGAAPWVSREASWGVRDAGGAVWWPSPLDRGRIRPSVRTGLASLAGGSASSSSPWSRARDPGSAPHRRGPGGCPGPPASRRGLDRRGRRSPGARVGCRGAPRGPLPPPGGRAAPGGPGAEPSPPGPHRRGPGPSSGVPRPGGPGSRPSRSLPSLPGGPGEGPGSGVSWWPPGKARSSGGGAWRSGSCIPTRGPPLHGEGEPPPPATAPCRPTWTPTTSPWSSW